MQDEITTFKALIDRWPSMRQFAAEAGAQPEQGRIFYRRNRVPKTYHRKLADAALARGLHGVTTEFLAQLYAAGRGEGR